MVTDLIFAVLLCLTAGCGVYRYRKACRAMDRLLDCILDQKETGIPELEEGELSALAHKAGRIREILGRQMERAEEEKEQVKSLVSNISHQLKMPLTNLSVYTDILTGQGVDDSHREEAAEKLKKQVDKLDWIISSLGKMVRLEQNAIVFEAEGLPIRRTILDAIDTVYGKIDQKEIVLTVEPYEDLLLHHNRKWTAEVFVNLLENAVKYSGQGGRIQIQVRPYEIYTEIRFLDNGCGIREAEIPLIFQRFYRSKDASQIEGSGIGLYLSGLILEKEKGYMAVKSVHGEGSCFSVFLQNCKG